MTSSPSASVEVADERLACSPRDTAALEDIERQLAQYRADLAKGFALRMSAVEKVLLEMESARAPVFRRQPAPRPGVRSR